MNLKLALLLSLGLVAFSACSVAQSPDLLRIQILNGRTGRPVANTHILLGRSAKLEPLDDAKTNKGVSTDGEGDASIPATDAPALNARVDFHPACARNPQTFSLMNVRAKGLVSDNVCSKRIKLFPQPGTLILFVREETFLEKMRH